MLVYNWFNRCGNKKKLQRCIITTNRICDCMGVPERNAKVDYEKYHALPHYDKIAILMLFLGMRFLVSNAMLLGRNDAYTNYTNTIFDYFGTVQRLVKDETTMEMIKIALFNIMDS